MQAGNRKLSNKFENGKGVPMGGFATRWDEQWVRQYGHLVRYRLKHKDAWPSTLEEFPKGNRLGQWTHRQRDLHGRRKLEASRVKLLNKLDFPWDKPDERESHWMRQFQYLKEYRKARPGEWPFAREEFPKNNRLGLWVWRQRQNYARKKLEKDRQQMLLKIGFPLVLPDTWESHFQTLKDYRAKHPDRWPKAREEFPAGNRLGLWCHLQRCAYKADKLEPDRTAKLNRIGFQWSVKNLGWTRYYEMLKDYKKRNAAKWPTLEAAALDDKKLISWCSAQRHKRKMKKLDKEKIELLNKLGFRW
jgi:uncharacterized short protein YbdD (DUF466 family)